MLDTVLEIGRVLRASSDGLKHHRYIKRSPETDPKRNQVRFWQIPVNEDGTFDFALISSLDDENKQKRLFYLNYKQSDADSTKPYLYGDLYRTVTKTGEDGNFRFGDPAKKSWMALNSFQRAESITALTTDRVKAFRDSFRQQMETIERFLRDNANAYIHFDFGGRCWHEMEEVALLNKGLVNTFFERTRQGYISRAFLYKTLSPGSNNAPEFQEASRYKTRVFHDEDQALDLIYGVNYASRQTVRVRDVKIVVLPRGDGLTAKQIERFFERTSVAESEAESDTEAEAIVQSDLDDEPLFSMLTDDEQTRTIAQFDFVFSIAGGTKADVDMIELVGLERSNLTLIRNRIKKIRVEVETEREAFQLKLYGKPPKTPLKQLRITQSLLNILSNRTSAEKKYQRHLYQVLPKIYTASYYHDPLLLPAFIEKTEANIRNDAPNFNLLKFDFYYLTRLQNDERNRLVEIQNSPSYRVGLALGKLAKQFSGPKSPIKSFEKNYVGLLSRRITTLPDVIELSNDINQKLVMHELSGFTFRTSTELAREINQFSGRYDKNECAFGFFESYFAPLPTKSTDEGTDNDTTIP